MSPCANDSIALDAARRAGYRVAVHDKFFPFESINPARPGTVHAVVDHGARAIFCSQVYADAAGVK